MNETKRDQLETSLKDMFRNHNMESAIKVMVNNQVCRNLLRQFFDEYESEVVE